MLILTTSQLRLRTLSLATPFLAWRTGWPLKWCPKCTKMYRQLRSQLRGKCNRRPNRYPGINSRRYRSRKWFPGSGKLARATLPTTDFLWAWTTWNIWTWVARLRVAVGRWPKTGARPAPTPTTRRTQGTPKETFSSTKIYHQSLPLAPGPTES